MKSIVISLRINPHKLAKALDGLRQYDPSFIPTTISEIASRAIDTTIGMTCHNLPMEPSAKSLQTILEMTSQGRKRQSHRRTSQQQIEPCQHPLTNDCDLGSEKSIVTDFSPIKPRKE